MGTASTKIRTRLLLVEDDYDTRMVLGLLLGETSYRVHPVEDGLAALDVIHGLVPGTWGDPSDEPHRPDLILLDLCMPRMTGWEFLTALRSDQKVRDIPVVVVTASPIGSPRVQACHAP